MSLYTLKVTIVNNSNETLTLQQDQIGNAPQTINPKSPGYFEDHSNWSGIGGYAYYVANYQGTQYTFSIYCDKESAIGGSDHYAISYSPDDDTYNVSYNVDSHTVGTDVVTFTINYFE